jgi:hypothetical protein
VINPVSKFAFKWVNLYRYVWGRLLLHKRYTTADFVGAGAVTAVGLYKVNPVVTHRTLNVIAWLQAFAFKINLYRYTAGCFIFVLDRGVLRSDAILRGVEHESGADAGALALAPGAGGGEGDHYGRGGGKFSLTDLDDMVAHPFNVWFESVKPHSELHQYILVGLALFTTLFCSQDTVLLMTASQYGSMYQI